MITRTNVLKKMLLVMLVALALLGVSMHPASYAQPNDPDFSIDAIRRDLGGSARSSNSIANRSLPGADAGPGFVRVESNGVAGIANVSLLSPSQNPQAIAVGHLGGVTLAWDAEPQATAYRIVRDGELVGTVVGGVYDDQSAPAGVALSYQILPVEEAVFAASHGVEVVRPASASEVAPAAVPPRPPSKKTARITWQSFIRQQYLQSPGTAVCDYSTAYSFGGDNRGFALGGSYRTQVHAVVNWENGGFSFTRSVGATKVYRNSDKKLVATKIASSNNLKAQKLAQSTSSRVEVYFTKSVGNPFCGKVPNAIEGFLRTAVTRDGAYSVLGGQHLQMPAHVVYLGDIVQTDIYRRSELNAICLQKLVCGTAPFSGVGKYY